MRPVYLIEATPKVDHVYGKKIFCLDGQAFGTLSVEIFDRQGKLWKVWLAPRCLVEDKDGEKYPLGSGNFMYDIQKDHLTRITLLWEINNPKVTVEDFSLKKLMEMGE